MSYVDALSRINQIEQQISELQAGSLASTAGSSAAAGTGSVEGAGSATTTPDATANFADALAQAQGTSGVSSLLGSASSAGIDTGSSLSSTLLAGSASLTGGAGVGTGSATLPAAATSMLTTDQQQFASRLAADTGLNPGVISAWLLAEESGGAAQSRQAAGNNDWLNIGYTGSGTYGANGSEWSDPVTAADATAGWLSGQNTIPGYGTASSSIQGILSTVGQSPQAQISALQNSGWAGSGYPDLPALYNQVTA